MGCIGLFEGVHIAQRQMTTQIPIEFCILVISLGLGLGLSHCQSDRAKRPIYTKRESQFGVNAAMTLTTQSSLTTMESL